MSSLYQPGPSILAYNEALTSGGQCVCGPLSAAKQEWDACSDAEQKERPLLLLTDRLKLLATEQSNEGCDDQLAWCDVRITYQCVICGAHYAKSQHMAGAIGPYTSAARMAYANA